MKDQNIAAAVNTGRFDGMSVKARASLGEIVNFVKRRQCHVELSDSKHSEPIARITPEFSLPEDYTLTGRTSLIGTVVRVGGGSPKVSLKLPTGKTLHCDTSEEIAKALGHRLYDVVTCKGEACWDIETNQVIKFKIKDVGGFKDCRASEAFAALAGAMPDTIKRWRSEGLENVFPGDNS